MYLLITMFQMTLIKEIKGINQKKIWKREINVFKNMQFEGLKTHDVFFEGTNTCIWWSNTVEENNCNIL
jgi:hypothetical protein